MTGTLPILTHLIMIHHSSIQYLHRPLEIKGGLPLSSRRLLTGGGRKEGLEGGGGWFPASDRQNRWDLGLNVGGRGEGSTWQHSEALNGSGSLCLLILSHSCH